MAKLSDLRVGMQVYIGGGIWENCQGIIVGFMSGQVNVHLDLIGDQLIVPRIIYIQKPPPSNDAWPNGFPSVTAWTGQGKWIGAHPLFDLTRRLVA